MKSIKIYLLPLFMIAFFGIQGFSQNDFYYDEIEKEKLEQKFSKMDSLLIYGYFTEKDYNEANGAIENRDNEDSEFYYGDENYNKEEPKKRKKDNFLSDVAAEVIVEVIVNALFIVATFWQ